ncbi:DUF6431 domain-containing protein [Pseudonocardia alni]|uniref:DUF6431 domain-containing protein n=1 Tax=Pseudonocardia alni TaxID=33907 RepID=UPI0036D0EA39
MIGIVDVARAEADLAAGELACPGCGAALRRWGHARTRRVRDHASTTTTLRPRRARCTACRATHVLLLGAVLPRRADTTAVIGTALLASASGSGYARIAADFGRPASTVRRWVRSVRGAHAEWLRVQAIGWIAALDRDVISTLAPRSSRLGDALNAVAAAALTVRERLVPHVPIWTVIGRVTGWRLVPPAGG